MSLNDPHEPRLAAASAALAPTTAGQALALEAIIAECRYPRSAQPALRDIALEVQRGEFVVVVGPSGSGKTTLCYALAGVIPRCFGCAFQGQVRIGGQDLARLRLPEIARLVGLVLQRPESQLFTQTVAEDVAFGPENLGLGTAEVGERVARSLSAVGLTGFEARLTDRLSGGETQRVALASVLALDPEVLILDQPTAELDAAGRGLVYEHLGRLSRQAGRTVVVVADRLRDVLPHATRVVHLDGGRIVERASPRAARMTVGRGPGPGQAPPSTPATPVTPTTPSARQMAAAPGPASEPDARGATGACPPGPATEWVAPRGDSPGRSAPSDADAALEARGLGYRFPGAASWALQDVDLCLRRGEVTALVGANGAGKSTLAKHFVGLLRPTRGQVRVLGRDARGLSTARLADSVGYLFQDPDYQLFADSVFDEVAFGLRVRRTPEAQVEAAVGAALGALGLLALRGRHPYTLSRLQRQRLALASILVRQPPVLVADEPTAGFGAGEAAEVLELLGEHARRGGAVLLVTHDLALVARCAARAVVLAAGRVQLDIPSDRLRCSARDLAGAGLIAPEVPSRSRGGPGMSSGGEAPGGVAGGVPRALRTP